MKADNIKPLLLKLISYKVSVQRAMPVVSVASKYEPKNRWYEVNL